ncbi:MAG: DNA-binding protein [Gemmatimonadetes bacterium]|nr:DNA-binding protein [Gemmatimonadota bacterium]
MSDALNRRIADRLDEAGQLLREQGANRFRVEAYHRAANVLRNSPRSVADILRLQGIEGLTELPGISETLARAIHQLARTGQLPMLQRLRGERDPISTLTSVPGIGPVTADRLYHDRGIGTLEDLEAAAHDGRLQRMGGFGAKRLAGVRDALAARLGRVRPGVDGRPSDAAPPVSELLDVDREYRSKESAGQLQRIAPRRFNPQHQAWLPILHTTRGERHYTALFSNTARAHRLGTTRDWVILYCDGARGERQFTVITAQAGSLRGRRIIRGREAECADHYWRTRSRSPLNLGDRLSDRARSRA